MRNISSFEFEKTTASRADSHTLYASWALPVWASPIAYSRNRSSQSLKGTPRYPTAYFSPVGLAGPDSPGPRSNVKSIVSQPSLAWCEPNLANKGSGM